MDEADFIQSLLHSQFDDELLNESAKNLQDGRITNALENLSNGLREKLQNSSVLEWDEFVQFARLHPLNQMLMQCPATSCSQQRSRKHSLSADLIDLLCGDDGKCIVPEGTTQLGAEIYREIFKRPIASGFRARVNLVAGLVDDVSIRTENPRILSVASGHLCEADQCGALKQRRVQEWVVFDYDADNLMEINQRFGSYNVRTEAGTIDQIVNRKTNLGDFDFIYSTTICDFLPDPLGQRMVQCMFDMLRPGGQLLVANFRPNMPDIGFKKCFMDWQVVYRSDDSMFDLARKINPGDLVQDIRFMSQGEPYSVFVQVTKKYD